MAAAALASAPRAKDGRLGRSEQEQGGGKAKGKDKSGDDGWSAALIGGAGFSSGGTAGGGRQTPGLI